VNTRLISHDLCRSIPCPPNSNGMKPPDDKAAILAEIAAARARLNAAASELHAVGESVKSKLDVPTRVGESYRKHRPAWLGGAALFGLILSKLPSRKKTVYVDRESAEGVAKVARAGFAWGAVKMLVGLAKPLVSDIAMTRFSEWAARQAQKRNGSNGHDDSVR
jgi:hypothetical protein